MSKESNNNDKGINKSNINSEVFDEDELEFVKKESLKLTKDILDSSNKNKKKFNW